MSWFTKLRDNVLKPAGTVAAAFIPVAGPVVSGILASRLAAEHQADSQAKQAADQRAADAKAQAAADAANAAYVAQNQANFASAVPTGGQSTTYDRINPTLNPGGGPAQSAAASPQIMYIAAGGVALLVVMQLMGRR